MKFRYLSTLIMLLHVCLAQAETSNPLLVINNTNAPPFTTSTQNGFLDIVVTEALRRVGARLELIKQPAERALLNADSGRIDGDLTRIKGLETLYPNLIRVPEKLVDWEFVAFARNPQASAEWPYIRKQQTGHITGWKIYEKAMHGADSVISATTPEQLFYLLEKDRIDIALHARWMGHGYIQQLGLQGIVELSPPLAKKEMFIYLNKRHAALADEIAKALRELKREGFYQKHWEEIIGPYRRQGRDLEQS